MLMQLAERGKVNLNDPLIKYIPGYKPKYLPNTGPTTLRQLATHTAGLHVDAAQGFWHYLSNLEWVVSKGKEKIVWGVTKNDLLSTLDKVEIEYTPICTLIIRTSVFNSSVLLWKMRRTSLLRNTSNPISSIARYEEFRFQPHGRTTNSLCRGLYVPGAGFSALSCARLGSINSQVSGGLCSTPEDIARFISFQFRINPAMMEKS